MNKDYTNIEGCDPLKNVPAGWRFLLATSDAPNRFRVTLMRSSDNKVGEYDSANFAIGKGSTFRTAMLAACHACTSLDSKHNAE